MDGITFADFSKLATKRRWTPEFLAERFRGKIEEPSEFFHRVMLGKYADVAIPYRTVLAFYFQELRFDQAESGRARLCVCGCGRPVAERKKWAFPGCKKRSQRAKATDRPEGVEKSLDFATSKPGQKAGHGLCLAPGFDPGQKGFKSEFHRDE
ncbi:MAG: hypothetical protein HY695_25575 [Deltaproteobacteria bacterium]|nr:hypothetical protein [Deltaproteobacteria bacterium]